MLSAEEYLKERGRMTDNCNNRCKDCPLSNYNNSENIYCVKFETNYSEKAVQIVEDWSKANPKKTNLDVFDEKIKPLIDNTFGVKNLYCYSSIIRTPIIFCTHFSNCDTCKEFWKSEYKPPLKEE